jgi:hypothetical protein
MKRRDDGPEPLPTRPREPLPRLREDLIPDVRDGLTRVERVVLVCLSQCENEWRARHGHGPEVPARNVSTAMLYGRVVEHVNLSVPEFQRILQRLVGVR